MTILPNVGSQLDRSIRAYGLSLGLNSIPIAGMQGSPFACQISTANNVFKKSYPNVTIHSMRSQATPQSNMFDVMIKAEMTIASNPFPKNLELPRVIMDAVIGAWDYALKQVYAGERQYLDTVCQLITAAGNALATTGLAQDQANNYDMANFTLQHMIYTGDTRGEPNEGGASFVEVRNFRCQVQPVTINLT
jgi:hypothetical protein